uniref:Reverse transcriptase domain-containing protein n=1 Tax=Tanacetum cinerariifolium TaxID=118510 RepID=A0A6L2KGB6_TANCI|nr:reverse transcriptase domain-containing protein [Tanacetum cinerariifolium]
MLAPRGEGLILYQAYGNLYAMTGLRMKSRLSLKNDMPLRDKEDEEKEYVAVKEDEYDDLARTSDDACRAYQEIFRRMDEGWMNMDAYLDEGMGDVIFGKPFLREVGIKTRWTPRYSEAYRNWRSSLLSTVYPSTKSESSAGDSFSESTTGPSHKRSKSRAAIVISSIHALRALVPSHADLLPPRKRFRDSISLEDSVEEGIDIDVLVDIEADATTVKVATDIDVEAGVDAGIGIKVDVMVDVEDEVEGEVKSSDRGTMEVGVDVVAEIDIPDGMLMPDAVERLEQDIEARQRELESSLIASGERAGLLDKVMSLERSNTQPRGTLRMASARVDRFRRHMSFMAGEIRQIHSQSQNGDDDDNGNVGGNGNRNGRGNEDENGGGNENRNGGGNGNGNSSRNDRGAMFVVPDAAFSILRREVMKIMTEVYCPRNEIQKIESELWNLTMKNNDLAAYTQRFQELTMMCTKMGNAVKNTENKRRLDNNQKDNHMQQPMYKRQNVGGQSVARAYTASNDEKRGYARPLPYCNKSGKNTNEARGKAYVLGQGEANPDSNVVTGTFLLNNHYASMLYDSGVNRSFMSSTFSALLDVIPYTLDVSYAVELADGRVAETNTVLRGCTLGLLGHPFNIDLMPVELGSFDVIIGMDWLANHHAVIVCNEKIVRIPYGDEVLIVQGDRSGKEKKSKLRIISCTKTQKYIKKGCQIFLAQVTKKKTKDKSKEK